MSMYEVDINPNIQINNKEKKYELKDIKTSKTTLNESSLLNKNMSQQHFTSISKSVRESIHPCFVYSYIHCTALLRERVCEVRFAFIINTMLSTLAFNDE